jgi:hypothetical protein
MSNEDRPITGSGTLAEIMIEIPAKGDPEGKVKHFSIKADNLEGTATPEPYTKIILKGVRLTSQQENVFEFELLHSWRMSIL